MILIHRLLLLLGILSLSSCASIRETTSTPPAAAIIFGESFSMGDSVSSMHFPAGRYLPMREDKHGFYFQAPQEAAVKDQLFGSRYKYNCGVYWKRDEAEPSQLYVNALYGRPMKFPAPFPPYELEK